MTWPYRYDFSIYQSSSVTLTAAAVLFVLSFFIRKRVTLKIVALQDASPVQNSRFFFAKYPPTGRLDILGLDVTTIALFLLPVLMV